MRHPAGSHIKRSIGLHLASQLILATTFASFAFAQETNNVRAVRISYVEGTVQILDDNGVVFDQAHPNMPVTQDMHLKTGSDGRAEVQFEDGSVARITPNSAMNFKQLQRTSEGDTITQLEAAAGITYYEFNNRGGKYTVQVGPYKVSATKSSIFRVAMDENPIQIAVMRGAVHVETGNESGLDLLTNQTASLDMKDTSSYDVAQNITADSWDQWNSDRDQHLAQLGSRATMARAVGGGNPDDPAWSDLDAYGNWYDMPGYGMGWMPYGPGVGFDPFGSGYWGYYPGYGGYTWISAYPWGWLPYHCGAWNWFNSTGWMWFPGNCGWGAFGNGWYPVTTVWNAPPNYLLPKRPITPLHGPIHMPPQQALVAVGHAPVQVQPRLAVNEKPIATPIKFDGKTLHPIETTVHPRVAGPLGESFTVASGYVPPSGGLRSGAVPVEGIRATYPGGTVAMPAGGMPRGTIAPSMPRNTVAPSSMPRNTVAPPSYHPAPGSGVSSPHYSAPSAPSSAPRMSAPAASPAPSAGARPH
jgi:FecR protein